MEDLKAKIEKLIQDKEYISAYMYVREDKDLQLEYAGKIVNAAVAELSSLRSNSDKERIYYLRSILLWIFRDIPGLAPIYRSQVREGSLAENTPDMFKLFTQFVSSSTRTVPKSPEEAAENVKETMDGVFDDIKSGKADEKIQDFFDIAGEGVQAGINGLSRFFDSLANSASEETSDNFENPNPERAVNDPEFGKNET